MSDRKVLLEVDVPSTTYYGEALSPEQLWSIKTGARIVQPALAQGDDHPAITQIHALMKIIGGMFGEVAANGSLSGPNAAIAMSKLYDIEQALSAQREQPTKRGDAQLMQNHYAAGFSCALHVAERQDLMSHVGSPEYLKRMANDLSQPAEQPQGVETDVSSSSSLRPEEVVVQRSLLDRLTTPLSKAEQRVLEQTDRLDAINELRALLGQREG